MFPVPRDPSKYGNTERIVGSWLKARKNRDKIILATKVAGPRMTPTIREGEVRLDRRNILAAVETSLQRLQTDYIDLYQTHWPDRVTNNFGQLGLVDLQTDEEKVALEETLAALDHLVASGKVRHIGVSNETPWGVMRQLALSDAGGMARLQSIQNPYSLLNRSFEVGLSEIALREAKVSTGGANPTVLEGDTLAELARKDQVAERVIERLSAFMDAEDVGLLAYSPLGMGALSGKYLNGAWPEGARMTLYPDFKRYLTPQGILAAEKYVALARQHDLIPEQMALAFVLQQKFVTAAIIGATDMGQLKTDIGAAAVTLDDAVLAEIEAIHRDHMLPCP